MENNTSINNNTSVGGILGALAGTAASVRFHKEQDKPIGKAAKTGLFAAIGFYLGNRIENWLRKKQTI